MIQRIQTVFLGIATAAFITQLLSPMLKSTQLAVTGIYQDGLLFTKESTIPLVVLLITALISLIAIFLFKNRKIQKSVVLLAILFVIAGNVVVGYSFLQPTEDMMKVSQANIVPGLGAFMPIIGLISLILAYRGIAKDEKIIKSMDRLR